MQTDHIGAPRPTALLVEDDPDAAHVASAMLGMLGYETQLAVDGQSALKALASKPPDLLMLDVCLPDLDGPKVLRVARRLADAVDMPAIAASAIVSRGAPEIDELRALGVSEFLAKPFNLSALRRALGRAHPLGPCGVAPKAVELSGQLLWSEGRGTATVFEARPLTVRLRTDARGLNPGQEVQLKLTRAWEEAGDKAEVPVRVFGNVTELRATDAGTRLELRVQVAVPREHWLGLCDDLRS
jgi:two-component system, cell cycle response regulator DivK